MIRAIKSHGIKLFVGILCVFKRLNFTLWIQTCLKITHNQKSNELKKKKKVCV